MKKLGFIIAIDGTAASGKGTLSKALAKAFNFDYLDTGLLYRIAAYNVLMHHIETINVARLIAFLKELEFKGDENINYHTEEIGAIASKIAAIPEVRMVLNDLQKIFPLGRAGVVIDGRDIGTVIFPNADLKFFIAANLELRAERRFKQLKKTSNSVIFVDVLENLRERDERDIQRKVAPTVSAPDAIVIDTSNLNEQEVFELTFALAQKTVNMLAA